MNGGIRIFRSAAAALLATMLIAGCAEKPEAMLASAKEHLANNDRSAAVIQLRNALQKDPDLAEARFLLGKSLFENGELASAEKELRRANELQFSADRVVPLLARTLVARGEAKKAVVEFANVSMVTPEGKAELLATIGQALLALNERDAARAAFASSLAAIPNHPPALVGEARLKAAAGDIDGAVVLVDTALAKSPSLTEGWQLKGDLMVAQRRLAPAVAAYRKAVDTKADHVPAHFRIVLLLLQEGKSQEAAEQLEAMKKAAPKHPQTLYLQALLAFRDKNYAAARDAIQLHLKAAGPNLAGMLLGAQIDYQLGAYAQAESALLAVLQRVPAEETARRLLVQLYVREGKPAKALATLKPILDEGKKDSNLLALAGEVYMQNGDAAAAARYFEESAALDPKNTRKRTAVALSHLAKGESERGIGELEAIAADDTGIRADLVLVATNVRRKKFDAALAAVAAIEKKQPDKPLPHSVRGGVLLAKGDNPGARRSFERAVAIDPTYYQAVASLARLDLAEKKPDDARKRFEAVLAKDPKNTQALIAIAGLRARAGGTTDEVAALIGKAVEARPTESEPRLALIAHYLRANEPKKAVAAAQDAVTAVPDRPEILDAAGRAYRAAGDSNQAIITYKNLAQLRPESTLALMRMAEIQVAANDSAAAIDNLNRALAINPDLDEARRAIIALDVSSGRTKEALAAARDVQKKRPKEPVGYILEGNIHAYAKAWSEAVAVYRAGLKQAESTELAIRLHRALNASRKGADADSFSGSWMKEHPKDRVFRHYLAQLAIGNKNYASAVQQYGALLEIEPNDAMALNNLAWVAGQLKDPKALDYAERANKLSPNSPAVLDTFGMLLIERGEVKRGVEMLQKATVIAPGAAFVRLNLARALIKDGQKDAARKELDTLAKLGDKFPEQAEVARLIQSL